MMTTVTSLDERLRAKGRKELQKELDTIFNALSKFAGWDKTNLYQENSSKGALTAYDVSLKLKDACYKAHVSKYEQKAIDEFLNDFGRLQSQVEDLESH